MAFLQSISFAKCGLQYNKDQQVFQPLGFMVLIMPSEKQERFLKYFVNLGKVHSLINK